MSSRTVSVIIRAKDEAASIGRTLDLLAAQTRPPDEVIVVDSGSADATRADRASQHGARVIEIPAESFTFGGSLNTGCAAATRGPARRAVGARVPDATRLARVPARGDGRRARSPARRAPTTDPHGAPLRERVLPGRGAARAHSRSGATPTPRAASAPTSGGGARSARTCRRPRTRSGRWYWLDRGYVAAIDPELLVDHDHSEDSLAEQYRRARIEQIGFSMFLTTSRRASRPRAVMVEGERGLPQPVAGAVRPRRIARRRRPGRRGRPRARRARRRRAACGSRWSRTGSRCVSETFVANEVDELRRAGPRVLVEATSRARAAAVPTPGSRSPTSRRTPLARKLGAPGRAGAAPPARGRARPRRAAALGSARSRCGRLRALAPARARLRRAGVDHIHVHFAAGAALDAMRLSRPAADPLQRHRPRLRDLRDAGEPARRSSSGRRS